MDFDGILRGSLNRVGDLPNIRAGWGLYAVRARRTACTKLLETKYLLFIARVSP